MLAEEAPGSCDDDEDPSGSSFLQRARKAGRLFRFVDDPVGHDGSPGVTGLFSSNYGLRRRAYSTSSSRILTMHGQSNR